MEAPARPFFLFKGTSYSGFHVSGRVRCHFAVFLSIPVCRCFRPGHRQRGPELCHVVSLPWAGDAPRHVGYVAFAKPNLVGLKVGIGPAKVHVPLPTIANRLLNLVQIGAAAYFNRLGICIPPVWGLTIST